MPRRTIFLAFALFAALAAPAEAAVSITDESAGEGGTVTFTVTRTAGDIGSYSARTLDGSAVAPGDYTAKDDGLTFDSISGGTATFTVTTIQDTSPERDETFVVQVRQGSTVVDVGTGTITDDDPAVATPRDAAVQEGQTAQLAIDVTPKSSETDLAIRVEGAGNDVTGVPSSVKVPPNTDVVTVPATITDDTEDEDAETFALVVTAPGGEKRSTITIAASDLRLVSAGDTSVIESDDDTVVARVPLVLSAPTTRTVTVQYGTLDGAATAPRDYLARLGTVTFRPGQTEQFVEVPIVGDDLREDAEAFGVLIGETSGAQVFKQGGVVAITDDDVAGSTTASGDDVPPRMKLGNARLSTSRSIRMLVSCPRGEQRCRGRVVLYTKPNRRGKARLLRTERRIGSKSFTLPGDASRTLRFTLPSSIARALRQNRRMGVEAFLLARDAGDNYVTTTRATTLRAKR